MANFGVFFFFFFIQAGFVYAFTWFVARLLFPGASVAMLGRWRNGLLIALGTMPFFVYAVFRFTLTRADLPPNYDPPGTLSLLPASWVALMVAAAALALTIVKRQRARLVEQTVAEGHPTS